MIPRLSVVQNIKVNTLIFSSLIHVGDSLFLTPRANVFAVQREGASYNGNEGNLDAYPIFTQPIPKNVITEQVNMNIINKSPVIKVNNIRVIGMSTVGVIHIGSTKVIDAESRLKHIRQLISGERPV